MSDFLLVEDVAEKLNMTHAAVRALIRRGDVVAYKFGKEWRIQKADLADYIDSTKLRSASEVAENVRRSMLERRGSSIDTKSALDKIEETVQQMGNKDNRLVSYSIVKAILDGLDAVAVASEIPIGNYASYKRELLWSCEAICGLNDGNGHNVSQHLSWAYGAINKLKSPHCFNL